MVYLYALRYSMWNMYYGMCISKRCSFQFSLTFVTSQGIASHLNMSVGIWIYAEQSISNPLINYLFTFKVFAELCEQAAYSRPEREKMKWNETTAADDDDEEKMWHTLVQCKLARQSINVGKISLLKWMCRCWFWLNCVAQVLKYL